MNWQVTLRLGRVSNLPTVWTNTLTGIVLAGGAVASSATLPLLVALSLFYVGGMYLNDAFDARIDAAERPERPIPSGVISAQAVFGAGFAMLALGTVILFWAGYALSGGTGFWPGLGGIALAGSIVLYDWHHKNNPMSPLLMGLCRVLVYVAAGLAIVVPLPAVLWLAALLLLCYLIGLTYVAKQENLGEVKNLWPLLFLAAPMIYALLSAAGSLTSAVMFVLFAIWVGVALWFLKRREPGDVPRAVVSLIAGIALLDAVLIAAAGAPGVAWLAVGGFALTIGLQRLVPGT
ncbi:MAG: UbiA family prenyltransferase [Pseudomonadota bacterium]